MISPLDANERASIDLLDRQFASLIDSLSVFTQSVPNDLLYRRASSPTIGENILKSAGVVEQTCGGITANLWDDPFEWTLPETLSTTTRILEYLSDVRATKDRAFASLTSDEVLLKYIAAPWSDSCRLLEVLLQTLVRAAEYRGRAFATLEMLSDVDTMGAISD